MVEALNRLSLGILHEAGLLASITIENIDKMAAEVRFENAGQKKNRGGRRKSESDGWRGQTFEQTECPIELTQSRDVNDSQHRVDDRPATVWSGAERRRPVLSVLEKAYGGKSFRQFWRRSPPRDGGEKGCLAAVDKAPVVLQSLKGAKSARTLGRSEGGNYPISARK